GDVGDAEAARQVDDPRLAAGVDELGHHLDVILRRLLRVLLPGATGVAGERRPGRHGRLRISHLTKCSISYIMAPELQCRVSKASTARSPSRAKAPASGAPGAPSPAPRCWSASATWTPATGAPICRAARATSTICCGSSPSPR